MKKISGLLFGLVLLFTFVQDAKASCVSVPTNQTTCSGTQTIVCSQVLPNAGGLKRWCCDTQLDCDNTKAGIKDDIDEKLKDPSTNLDNITCGADGKGIETAIGCIPVLGSTNEFLSSILSWAVGIGSGIAFLLMLYAGFMIMTAAGNPERIKAGQELLTSALAGLILLIFAVFILRFIGVDILGLDAFGFGK